MPDVLKLRWRVGRKLGRTLYAMLNEEPTDNDILLGMVDDWDVALHIVTEHNKTLDDA